LRRVKDSTREFVHRHAEVLGIVFFLGAMVIWAAVFVLLALPKSYGEVGMAVLIVAFAAFFIWGRTPILERTTPSAVLTIREHLRRTNAYSQRIIVPVAVAWIVGVLFYKSALTKMQEQALSIGGAVVLVLVFSRVIRRRLCCPRCGSDFNKERIAKVGRWSFNLTRPEDLWDACPHCGVSFDAPYEDCIAKAKADGYH
jgi:type III secretory pathway component EscS